MIRKIFGFLVLLALGWNTVQGQDLYVPRNINQAYKQKTRDRSGTPGEEYWQNRAHYKIAVEVKPPNRKVTGSETITYTNNSPDTLAEINFKLILNHHKPNAPRARAVPDKYLTDGIHIDSFKENGETRVWEEKETDGTDKFIKLKNPLLPGATITFDIDWHYKVSEQSGREGAISENTFFLGYFYPRIAVYDDYAGWDVMPHTTAQEFYNDFNDYEFEVRAPKNYLVWATGTLQNADEVLQQPYLNRFLASKTSDEVISIVNQEDLDKKEVTVQHEMNTWKWKADQVTDVAFAVSNEYQWDAGSVVVGDGRRVSAQAAYDAPSEDFEQMVDFIKHSVHWFSENYPGVPYPYPAMTVVRGFADMEFPMMANDSSMPDNPEFTRFVAEHEIAHTYMPFYMGTNETRFGFMDEGWATTFEYLIGIDDLGAEKAAKNFKNFRVKRWTQTPSFLNDLFIIIPSNVLNRPSLGVNEYGKASLAYLSLIDLLGEEDFKTGLQGYMARWNGKHPMPWDFFYSFNDVLGKNLNWFWKAWFFAPHYIDYKITKVEKNENKNEVTIRNLGGFPAPFDLVITYTDGSKDRLHQTPALWKDGKSEVKIAVEGEKVLKTIRIDNGIFMDYDITDNTWPGDE